MGAPSDPSVANINPGGANTNIVSRAGRLIAPQEQREPLELKSESFDGAGRFMTAGASLQLTPRRTRNRRAGLVCMFGRLQPVSNLIDRRVTADGGVLRRDGFTAHVLTGFHDNGVAS